tara:strand:- start:216 stop:476 length:261 start_codon:yes stop_codon:yes gene_type:complete
MKFKNIFISSLVLLFFSCAPTLMTSDQDSVSFYIATGLITDNLAEAQSAASLHCLKHSKVATLRDVSEVSKVPKRTLAIFDCVLPD